MTFTMIFSKIQFNVTGDFVDNKDEILFFDLPPGQRTYIWAYIRRSEHILDVFVFCTSYVRLQGLI